jgi:hypothetical protein
LHDPKIPVGAARPGKLFGLIDLIVDRAVKLGEVFLRWARLAKTEAAAPAPKNSARSDDRTGRTDHRIGRENVRILLEVYLGVPRGEAHGTAWR